MSWPRVRGHDGVIAAFRTALNRGRLGHAYLFVGPPAVGKRLVAVELARSLLCESPRDGDACDRCAACELVDAGTHPDLFEFRRPDDKNDLPIEVMRKLTEDLSLKPMRGGRKVAILDDADDLNPASANCFLKTLEEPPPASLLILIGESLQRQLPTIRSRCQVVHFAPLAETLVEEMLRSGDEPIEPAEAKRLARLAEGSPGRARDLADPDLWEFRKDFFNELAAAKPNGPKLAKAWMTLAESAGKDAAQQRRKAALVVRVLTDGFRQALRFAVGGDVDAADRAVLMKVAEKYRAEGVLNALDRLIETTRHVERRVQLALAVEAAVDTIQRNAM